MRSAALAFGILAGLVASLVLALGGLDASAIGVGAGDRQATLIRFGLLVVANIGIFAAALVLTAPLAAAILMLLGAIAWAVSALLLHHGVDLVLVTPPALMLVGAALALLSHLRRPAPDLAVEPLLAEPDLPDIDEDEPRPAPASRGNAVFAAFGATPARVAVAALPPEPEPEPIPDPLEGLNEADHLRAIDNDWTPRRRRPPPPRARSVFREPEHDDEDEDDEESGFAGFTRGAAGILSFTLYAALAAAAVLIVWNMRSLEPDTATTVVADASSSAGRAPSAPSERALTPILPRTVGPASLPSIAGNSAAAASLLAPQDELPSLAPDTGGSDDMGTDADGGPDSDDATGDTTTSRHMPFDDTAALAPRLVDEEPASAASSSAESALPPASVAPVMPYPMPPAMALARARPSSAPSVDVTGL